MALKTAFDPNGMNIGLQPLPAGVIVSRRGRNRALTELKTISIDN